MTMSEMLMPHAEVRPISVVVGLGAWPIGRGPVADLAHGEIRAWDAAPGRKNP